MSCGGILFLFGDGASRAVLAREPFDVQLAALVEQLKATSKLGVNHIEQRVATVLHQARIDSALHTHSIFKATSRFPLSSTRIEPNDGISRRATRTISSTVHLFVCSTQWFHWDIHHPYEWQHGMDYGQSNTSMSDFDLAQTWLLSDQIFQRTFSYLMIMNRLLIHTIRYCFSLWLDRVNVQRNKYFIHYFDLCSWVNRLMPLGGTLSSIEGWRFHPKTLSLDNGWRQGAQRFCVSHSDVLFKALNTAPTSSPCRSLLSSQKNAPRKRCFLT